MEKLVDLGCGLFNRVIDFPVDGFSVKDGHVHFYVHRDMPTEDWVRAFDEKGTSAFAPRLVRHSIPLDKLEAFTRTSIAALPSCAPTARPWLPLPKDAPLKQRYPPCLDANGNPDTAGIPYGKLNNPEAWAQMQAREEPGR